MSQPMTLFSPDMSEPERQLVLAVMRGEIADLRRQSIRGEILRDLILERRPGWLLPQAGIRIERAIVTGGIDLEGALVETPLMLWHSRIEAAGGPAVNIRDARLRRLGLHHSTVQGDILADRVQVFGGLFIGGGLVSGGLQIRGGDVHGALVVEGTKLGNGTTALLAAGLKVSGPLIIRRAVLEGSVAMPRANLGAGVYGEECVVRGGSSVDMESLKTDGDLLLERTGLHAGLVLSGATIGGRLAAGGMKCGSEGLAASGATITRNVELAGAVLAGPLKLSGAQIGGELTARGIEVHGGETAVAADVVRVGGNVDFGQAKLVGQLSAAGAEIAGQLRLTGARLFGAGIAMRGDGLRVRGGLFLTRAVVVGLVRLPAAEIGNQLRLSGASLKVEEGVALMAPGARVMRDMEIDGGFRSIGGLLLDQIRVGGALVLTDSHIGSVAIMMQAHRAASPVSLRARETTADRLALGLVDASVERLVMPDRAECRPRGIVDLSRARAGAYEDFAAAWPPRCSERTIGEAGEDLDHIVLDGFAYEHLTNPSGRPQTASDGNHDHRDDRVAERRIAWLEGQPMADVAQHLKPQAWVYLASRLAAQGYGEDARAVSIARRRRERRSHAATWAQRWQGALLDALALYGYNPWRTVMWMIVTILVFAAIFASASVRCERPGCFDETVFVVTNRDAYTPQRFENAYPAFNPLAYSLDVFVPFVSLGYEDHWRPNLGFHPISLWQLRQGTTSIGQDSQPRRLPTLTWGGLLYVATVVESILGLVLTSLAVTGFTGMLRVEE